MGQPGISGKQRLEQHLKDRGLSEYSVTHTTNQFTDAYTVKAHVGGELFAYDFTITEELTQHGRGNMALNKILAQHADSIVTEIENEFRTRYSLTVDVDVLLTNGGSARCHRCGAEAELPPQNVSEVFRTDAELSTPNPLPKNTDDYLSELSDHQKVVARLYLLARLRYNCEDFCPNSTETFKW